MGTILNSCAEADATDNMAATTAQALARDGIFMIQWFWVGSGSVHDGLTAARITKDSDFPHIGQYSADIFRPCGNRAKKGPPERSGGHHLHTY